MGLATVFLHREAIVIRAECPLSLATAPVLNTLIVPFPVCPPRSHTCTALRGSTPVVVLVLSVESRRDDVFVFDQVSRFSTFSLAPEYKYLPIIGVVTAMTRHRT